MKLSKKLTMLMLASLAFISVLASAQETVAFTEPEAIRLSKKFRYKEDEVKQAIVHAAEKEHWQVVSESPEVVRIKIQDPNNGTELVMDVLYNTKKFKLRYISSEGLNYQPASSPVVAGNNSNSNFVSKNFISGPSISRQYADWVKQLTRTIRRQIRSEESS
jgi:hypothetical protein